MRGLLDVGKFMIGGLALVAVLTFFLMWLCDTGPVIVTLDKGVVTHCQSAHHDRCGMNYSDCEFGASYPCQVNSTYKKLRGGK